MHCDWFSLLRTSRNVGEQFRGQSSLNSAQSTQFSAEKPWYFYQAPNGLIWPASAPSEILVRSKRSEVISTPNRRSQPSENQTLSVREENLCFEITKNEFYDDRRKINQPKETISDRIVTVFHYLKLQETRESGPGDDPRVALCKLHSLWQADSYAPTRVHMVCTPRVQSWLKFTFQ